MFNQDIRGWDVSMVTSTESMFQNALVFNHPIDVWNISNVENMAFMFKDATMFTKTSVDGMYLWSPRWSLCFKTRHHSIK